MVEMRLHPPPPLPLLERGNKNYDVSPECSSKFLSNLYMPPWLWKLFKFMVFRLLENTFANQNIEWRHFHSCLPDKILPKFLSHHQAKKAAMFFPCKGTILWCFIDQFIRYNGFTWVSSWHLFKLTTSLLSIFSLITNRMAIKFNNQWMIDDGTGEEWF